MTSCIFCELVRGNIPVRKILEDDDLLAFHDIHPQAPVHFLIIPKVHIATLANCEPIHEPVLGKMLATAPRLALELGLSNGFRTIINAGQVGGQEVYHLHMHVVGGPDPLGKMIAGR